MFAINEPVYQWYDKRLTAVPISMAEIMAMESGFCSSLPISNVKSSGTIPNIVVNDVMMIGAGAAVRLHVWLP